MNIQRIDSYDDPSFSNIVLNQHGGFLADGEPYEVEIISMREAVIRGREVEAFPNIIEEFRFYAPHITCFYDENHHVIHNFPPVRFLTVPLKSIQPSQFYVDADKVEAIRGYIREEKDVIIQVLRHGDRYVSLDGHTRLYYAAKMGWTAVQAVEETSGDYIFGFVEEAMRRGFYSPYDLHLVCHKEYEEKWNKFCDDFFAQKEH